MDSVSRDIDAWMSHMSATDQAVEELRQRIGRISRLFDRILDRIASSHEISRADWTALSVIVRAGNCCTPTELAESLELTSGTVSTRIKRLTEAGLIETDGGTGDARRRPVKATPSGLELWRTATAARTTYEARLVRTVVDDTELTSLNGRLAAVLDALEADLGVSPQHDLQKDAGSDR